METTRLDEGVVRTTLPNGLGVVSETMPGLRSAAVGFWVRTASAHESAERMGVSHLLEHMVFKGTERRTAQDIALALESRGGALDAYTGRDSTAFQARVLDADLPLAFDVLDDLVRRPLLREDDLVRERQVVIEEIATVDDTPDDLVFDLHANHLFPAHSYGYRILGTRDTVGALAVEDLRTLHGGTYHPGHIVVAAAGRVTHEELLAMLRGAGWFELEPGPEPVRVSPPAGSGRGLHRISRDTSQVHMVFGAETFRVGDPRRMALTLVTTILGGGMSSRLFQKVREDLGLAYTVYAFHSFFQSSGMAGVYVGTQPPTAQQAYEVITAELGRLARESLSSAELASAKQQVKGQIVLALEGPLSRMYRIAGQTLNEEPYKSIDAMLAEVDAVTPDQVAAAAEFFGPERQAVVWLGPDA